MEIDGHPNTQHAAPKRKSTPGRPSAAAPSISLNTKRNASSATIQRLLIEDDFVHWRSMWRMRHEWAINDRSSIYRHARAFGLMEQRRRNLRWSLEYILERSEECRVTADSIVSAAKLYTQLTDDGTLIERPKRVIVSHEMISHEMVSHKTAPQQIASREMLPPPTPGPQIPNRELPEPASLQLPSPSPDAPCLSLACPEATKGH